MQRHIFYTLVLSVYGALSLASCVNVDPNTGQSTPRGHQRFEFSEVTRHVDELEPGMSKYSVLILLGSPAEKSRSGDVWVYLPERAAILVPGRALRLQFRDGVLASHAYHAIVLGTRL